MADSIRRQFDTSLGLGISVNVSPDERAVYRGSVTVAIEGERQARQEFALRGGFEDVQRRSALSAADLLFRSLND